MILRIVGVMGGDVDCPELTEPLGQMIASKGRHLLTGAGGGVMEAVAKAFVETPDREGLSIGIVRANDICRHEKRWFDCGKCSPHHITNGDQTNPRVWGPRQPPNGFVEIPIFTHLPDSGNRGKEHTSRNHINVLSADVIVVLPGSSGTLSEAELALEYRRKVVFFVGKHTIGGKTAAAVQAGVPGAEAMIANSIAEVAPHL